MEDGGPSVTARRVAAHRLGFDRVPVAYGDPAADEALAVDVAAEALLARTGWRIVADHGEKAARLERLRSAGLLTATAAPRTPAASRPGPAPRTPAPSRPSADPAAPARSSRPRDPSTPRSPASP